MKRLTQTLLLLCSLSLIGMLPAAPACAEVQWSTLGTIQLDDTPKDIALSRDGTTAYVLAERSILLISLQENKVTEKIPLNETFERISLSADESTVYLTKPNAQQIVLLQISQLYEIPVGTSPIIGNPKAPVSVVAFLDFQCPYCARVYPTLKQLLEKYPKDVNLIIKHYPLPMHRFAEQAAKAALAANKQKKYDKMAEILFAHFKTINEQTIAQYAQEAGLDLTKFNKDTSDAEIPGILAADKQLAQKLRVRAVPTLFINGAAVKDRSIEGLSHMVEQSLKKKK